MLWEFCTHLILEYFVPEFIGELILDFIGNCFRISSWKSFRTTFGNLIKTPCWESFSTSFVNSLRSFFGNCYELWVALGNPPKVFCIILLQQNLSENHFQQSWIETPTRNFPRILRSPSAMAYGLRESFDNFALLIRFLIKRLICNPFENTLGTFKKVICLLKTILL